MRDLGTVTLETPRLTLRRLTVEDGPAMYQNWASDPEVTRYLTWPAHTSVEGTRAYLADMFRQTEEPDMYDWGIVLKELGEPVGNISVVERREKAACLQLGYSLGRRWWHQGIMSEAASRVIDFLFEEVGALRIEARYDTRNPHSGGVMEKCGMTFEGVHRQADWNNSGICDVAYYGILREDYERRRGDRA